MGFLMDQRETASKEPDSYTDPFTAWREVPQPGATYEACIEWLRRAEWLRYRTNDKSFRAALWGTEQRRNKRFTEREHELRSKAIRANVYWIQTPEGWRVNPDWKARLEEIERNYVKGGAK